jgi:hypothetical protein
MSISFNVTVVLDGVELTDRHLDHIFDELPDAVATDIGGLVTLTSPVDGPDAQAAAFRLVEIVGEVLPEAIVVRLDQDLVAISDIAARTARSRESIRLLVEGQRGPGGFPAPVGIVGDGIRVWPWASILDWFRDVLGEDLGEHAVPPAVAAMVDAHLATRRPSLARGPE